MVVKDGIENVLRYYPPPNKSYVEKTLDFLCNRHEVVCVYIAGAITFNRVDVLSDLDIHCVIKDELSQTFWQNLDIFFNAQPQFMYRTNEKSYPWFGEMRTFYIKTNPIFYIDIGFVKQQCIKEFYFQYKGVIIKDETGQLEKLVCFSNNEENNKIKSMLKFHMDQLLNTTIKINKDLKRKLFWNATENLMQLRRAFIFLFSYEHYFNEKYPFIGRPERDIEKIWSADHLNILQDTISNDTFDSIANAKDKLLIEALKLSCIQNNNLLLDILDYVLKTSNALFE
jgi:hypothetical protein